MVMTKLQVAYHLAAWKFRFEHLTWPSATEWDFSTIRKELDKLEQHHGAAYPTAGRHLAD